PAVTLAIGANSWPESVTFVRGPHTGETYSFTSSSAKTWFRSDMDNTEGLRIAQYGGRSLLQTVADGIRANDRELRFSPGTARDHIATEFFPQQPRASSLIFFSMWAKPHEGTLPALSLQNESYTFLAHAQPVIRRQDGWNLLLGWTEALGTGRLRVAIEPSGTLEIDKLWVLELPA